jgi:hypothetical protein
MLDVAMWPRNPRRRNHAGATPGARAIGSSLERSSMGIKLIPLSRLEADPRGTLTEYLDSGDALVVERPDHRLVSIRGLEPDEDDDLVDRLIASNPAFRASMEKSKASPRQPFPTRPEA